MINRASLSTLIIALRTEDRRAHTLVVDDLVRIGSPAVEALILALEDANPGVRAGAARALGKIGDARALSALVSRLRHDSHAEVRKSAVWALQMGGTCTIDVLIEALCDRDEWVRFGAIIVLSKIGEPSVEPLIAALQDPRTLIRANAAETLGRINDKRSADGLSRSLLDAESYVWHQAAIALGRMGDARAVYHLIAIVENENSDLRTKAIKALGQIRDVRAVDPLLNVVYQQEDRWMRLFAIEALGHIGDIRSVEALVDMAYDESRDLRTKAIVTLGEIDYTLALDALDYLSCDADVEPQDQQTALFELGKRGDARALEGLIGILQEDPHPDIRGYAAVILGHMPRAEAVEALLEALKDFAPNVTTQVIKALIKLGDFAVHTLLNRFPKSDSVEQRMSIVRILGEIATPRAITALMQVALDDGEQSWVRQQAREILSRLGYDPYTPA